MARKNIFEILEEKYDIEEEIRKISNLFNNMKFMKTNSLNFQSELYTIEKLVDDVFSHWKQRGSCLNCAEMREKLHLTQTFSDFDNIINTLEYYSNILYIVEYKIDKLVNLPLRGCAEYRMLLENIDILIDHLHYGKLIFDEDEKVILVPKDPAATAVAEISSKDIAFAILKYHHASLKGQIEEKRKLLLSIANEYEPLLNKPIAGFKEYFDKATNMLNNMNIRHNNKSGKNKKELVAQMSDEELESWYDELYQLLLFCVLIKDNKERKDKVDKLLKRINTQPKKQ